jgi:NADPH-dependent 2,4-dienoyl-CoA reductase/sulfur reductase-like enzyme
VQDYNNFYSLVPSKPTDFLVEAGLTKPSDGLLHVKEDTLQHVKYDNIFGIGDVNSLPTTKTLWGGFSQLHVVRHNLH